MNELEQIKPAVIKHIIDFISRKLKVVINYELPESGEVREMIAYELEQLGLSPEEAKRIAIEEANPHELIEIAEQKVRDLLEDNGFTVGGPIGKA